jgi:hypothetical protein
MYTKDKQTRNKRIYKIYIFCIPSYDLNQLSTAAAAAGEKCHAFHKNKKRQNKANKYGLSFLSTTKKKRYGTAQHTVKLL